MHHYVPQAWAERLRFFIFEAERYNAPANVWQAVTAKMALPAMEVTIPASMSFC